MAPGARQCSAQSRTEEAPESLPAELWPALEGWCADCCSCLGPACQDQNSHSLVSILRSLWDPFWAVACPAAFSDPANFTSLKCSPHNSHCHPSYNKSHRVPLPLRLLSCTHCPFPLHSPLPPVACSFWNMPSFFLLPGLRLACLQQHTFQITYLQLFAYVPEAGCPSVALLTHLNPIAVDSVRGGREKALFFPDLTCGCCY